MNCPRCNVPMTARTRERVEVDVCGQCSGVWLDGGELQKILELERGRIDAQTQADWRMYDRGREGYDTTTPPERERSTIESLLGDEH